MKLNWTRSDDYRGVAFYFFIDYKWLHAEYVFYKYSKLFRYEKRYII